jgi:hypothetical protein
MDSDSAGAQQLQNAASIKKQGPDLDEQAGRAELPQGESLKRKAEGEGANNTVVKQQWRAS